MQWICVDRQEHAIRMTVQEILTGAHRTYGTREEADTTIFADSNLVRNVTVQYYTKENQSKTFVWNKPESINDCVEAINHFSLTFANEVLPTERPAA